jgi:hypothetical protein
MKRLTATICLTIAVLLGSAAERLADVMAAAFLTMFSEAANMSELTETAIGDTWADTKA